ncbi:Low specificity L-threonine aldolase [Legionella nautarum]|uniref:Low specificity L-threonine aldolase n=1 Tax=Legionella nautarum TaxID=45070 RepID=A0A0W0WLI6_9GAMM|nr:low-specificity L-threonine aldolase [Legionella nautarum]KTD33196.1 Low specificity L-threonine aldolase [Legionella nautarum]
MKLIDLRSDTVTKPSKAMLSAMMNAETGDDVYGEDPTVKRLESIIAERAGMEAAVFAASGTQTNLMAIMAHCERGDEYIVGQTAHTYMSEGGGAAVLGSIQPQPIEFEKDGSLALDKIARVIKPLDYHYAQTKLLCLENTTAGRVLSLNYLREAKRFCEQNKLNNHLDGARVFNAAVKLGVNLNEISSNFDSISICLSKGLGTPVGSILCGPGELIKKARRWRKVLGGGMRQAGILAAAGIYALQHNIERLSEDHENAAYFAQALAEIDEIEVDLASLQTNILFIQVKGDYFALRDYLFTRGILLAEQPNKMGKLRCVTHLDVSRVDLREVVKQIKSFYTK